MKTILGFLVLSLSILASSPSALITVGAEEAKDQSKIQAPIVIEDQLSSTDLRDPVTNEPCKIHIVKLLAGKTYQISMLRKDAKQQFSPFLRVEDAAFKQVAANTGIPQARIKFNPPADGDYRFVATCQAGTGHYVLKIVPFERPKLRAYEPGKAHDVGAGGLEYDSKLIAADASDTVRKGHFAKIFLVKVLKNKIYTIEMDSTQFDSYLRLEDGKGKELAQDDDSGGFPNALITYQAREDDVFRIIATTFAGGAQGNFTLRVREE